jgi:hypothetical protein
MKHRIKKLFGLVICGAFALLFIAAGFYFLSDYIAYQKMEITTPLLRDGKYDPARHFKFDRACVFPPESALADTWLSQRGYRELDAMFPDTYTHWTLVLVDDDAKTFRTLYVLESKVKFGGQITCDPKLTLKAALSDGHITARAEMNAH